MQDDLNLRGLRIFEATFSLDAAYFMKLFEAGNGDISVL